MCIKFASLLVVPPLLVISRGPAVSVSGTCGGMYSVGGIKLGLGLAEIVAPVLDVLLFFLLFIIPVPLFST